MSNVESCPVCGTTIYPRFRYGTPHSERGRSVHYECAGCGNRTEEYGDVTHARRAMKGWNDGK